MTIRACQTWISKTIKKVIFWHIYDFKWSFYLHWFIWSTYVVLTPAQLALPSLGLALVHVPLWPRFKILHTDSHHFFCKISLTHFHSKQPKETWGFWKYFTYKSIFLKTFEGELLIWSQTTTLLQIFCELKLLNPQVIFKRIRKADGAFYRETLEC